MSDFIKNIDIGPGKTTFGTTYLGRTSGETQFNYSIETFNLETEEDGVVDEIVTSDPLTITVPMFETDVVHLETAVPWATLDGDTLYVGKAIGKRLSQYADELKIEPVDPGAEGGKEITIYKAYPKPGPVEFGYSRNGQRVANIQFVAMRDPDKAPDRDYFEVVSLDPQVAPVYATPPAGSYSDAQAVTLTCATAGATIYYTTDGSTPTAASTEFTGTPVAINSVTMLRAIATKALYRDSIVTDHYYYGALA